MRAGKLEDVHVWATQTFILAALAALDDEGISVTYASWGAPASG